VLLARSDVEFGLRSGKIVAGIWGGVEMEGLAEFLKALMSVPAWRDTLRNGTLSILSIIIKSTTTEKRR
jgi:hypothetical protein